jgi:hypothetical protein
MNGFALSQGIVATNPALPPPLHSGFFIISRRHIVWDLRRRELEVEKLVDGHRVGSETDGVHQGKGGSAAAIAAALTQIDAEISDLSTFTLPWKRSLVSGSTSFRRRR